MRKEILDCNQAVTAAISKMCEFFGDKIINVFEASSNEETDVRSAQASDPELRIIIDLVSENKTPAFQKLPVKKYRNVWRKLYVDDGVLKKKTKDGKGVLVVPEAKVSKILFHVHDGPVAAHYGISKCYYKLKSRFYFPSMVSRLSEYLENCDVCMRKKMPKFEPKPVPQPIDYDHYDIGGCISYDFKGPLPVANKSILYQCPNRYVLVIIDHVTRYVMAVPTPTMEASVVAEIIISAWIPRFGVPRTIISDRAKNFSGIVMKTIYKALQVDINLTAAYNPNANGLCEQVNRNITALLRILMDEGIDEWPKKLNILFSAYNATPQTSTGYSPNFLVYGRELIEPLDILLTGEGLTKRKEHQIFAELESRLALRRKALDVLALKFEERCKKVSQLEGGKPVETYEVGEQVGFRAPGKGNKLKKSFEINHKVIKVLAPHTYVIRNMESGFERIVNVRKMRKIKIRQGELEVTPSKISMPPSGFSEDETEEWETGIEELQARGDVDTDDKNGQQKQDENDWRTRLRPRNDLRKL